MAVLKKSGINVVTMRRQIESQVAWSRIIQKELRPRINISENDIESFLERLQGSKGMTEYLVAEIFLPVDHSTSEANTRQLAQRHN